MKRQATGEFIEDDYPYITTARTRLVLASYHRGINERFFIVVSPTLFPFPQNSDKTVL